MTKSSKPDADREETGQVSEGGSSFSNPETNKGGADAVPDTPGVNDTEGDAADPAVPNPADVRDNAQDDDA